MTKVKLVAAGDVLLHSRVYDKCETIEGNYDFNTKMLHAKKLLNEGDVTIVNLESIVAGKEFGLSSYPKFNNPIEVATTLKDYGTDIVSLANNHAYDHGEEGLLKSIENLRSIDLPYVGAHLSTEDRDTYRIIKKNGLRIGFLSFTRQFRAFRKIDKDKSYLINIFNEENAIPIRQKIQKMADSGRVDLVVVSLHFGKEYTLFPTAIQREFAAEISDGGADIILGHHPHVLQPPEIILNSRGKKTFFIPSLGNFYTGQHGVYRQIGGTISVELEKEKGNPVVNFNNPTLNLTFVDSHHKKDFKMYSFIDYIKENPYIKTNRGNFESLEILTELITRMRSRLPNLIIK
ncbi:CapA family protein [Halalkalibacter hemicellulosilyticus]|uniref:Poly-gamma-glutamic synthesis n=1 Tax=Halalkalibacter hemicellulosilyticusJCM 9152 TaxID=1236971 RepID=W4QLI1_9BACI|nr:CapA family protein [Halalkalibacter hemicellulosilyticus]GAE32767.1 poly-gamma-glutamic synthesis [Halalkalibacter hemicellulosilyticusJCM 9152]